MFCQRNDVVQQISVKLIFRKRYFNLAPKASNFENKDIDENLIPLEASKGKVVVLNY